MIMFKKLLHRATIAWCIYGLARLCVFVNPLVFKVLKLWKPVFMLDDKWNHKSPEQILIVWMCVLTGVFVFFMIFAAIHAFSSWFFNESSKDED
jgi:hypothetical protein